MVAGKWYSAMRHFDVLLKLNIPCSKATAHAYATEDMKYSAVAQRWSELGLGTQAQDLLRAFERNRAKDPMSGQLL